MERYVEIKPVVMRGWPDAHNVFLKATNQSFCVSPYGCESKEDAEWVRDMLCVALAKIVADNSLPPTGDRAAIVEEAFLKCLQFENKCDGGVTGKPCRTANQCGCMLELQRWIDDRALAPKQTGE